ncbi:hypothetical protein WR25_19718 [Diploscapter pachys]|uniref:Uncharacterized protein n=1 Tax=Diploscapter pachys TaxID=2018661 RepID=A0A2A2L385_9BILA|nr:hypothetical protein WR25_19718 [Diploscapter pachys]
MNGGEMYQAIFMAPQNLMMESQFVSEGAEGAEGFFTRQHGYIPLTRERSRRILRQTAKQLRNTLLNPDYQLFYGNWFNVKIEINNNEGEESKCVYKIVYLWPLSWPHYPSSGVFTRISRLIPNKIGSFTKFKEIFGVVAAVEDNVLLIWSDFSGIVIFTAADREEIKDFIPLQPVHAQGLAIPEFRYTAITILSVEQIVMSPAITHAKFDENAKITSLDGWLIAECQNGDKVVLLDIRRRRISAYKPPFHEQEQVAVMYTCVSTPLGSVFVSLNVISEEQHRRHYEYYATAFKNLRRFKTVDYEYLEPNIVQATRSIQAAEPFFLEQFAHLKKYFEEAWVPENAGYEDVELIEKISRKPEQKFTCLSDTPSSNGENSFELHEDHQPIQLQNAAHRVVPNIGFLPSDSSQSSESSQSEEEEMLDDAEEVNRVNGMEANRLRDENGNAIADGEGSEQHMRASCTQQLQQPQQDQREETPTAAEEVSEIEPRELPLSLNRPEAQAQQLRRPLSPPHSTVLVPVVPVTRSSHPSSPSLPDEQLNPSKPVVTRRIVHPVLPPVAQRDLFDPGHSGVSDVKEERAHHQAVHANLHQKHDNETATSSSAFHAMSIPARTSPRYDEIEEGTHYFAARYVDHTLNESFSSPPETPTPPERLDWDAEGQGHIQYEEESKYDGKERYVNCLEKMSEDRDDRHGQGQENGRKHEMELKHERAADAGEGHQQIQQTSYQNEQQSVDRNEPPLPSVSILTNSISAFAIPSQLVAPWEHADEEEHSFIEEPDGVDPESELEKERRNFVYRLINKGDIMKILTRVDKELNKSLTKLYWCEIRLTLSEYQKCARTDLQKDRVQQLFDLGNMDTVRRFCQQLLFEKVVLTVDGLRKQNGSEYEKIAKNLSADEIAYIHGSVAALH